MTASLPAPDSEAQTEALDPLSARLAELGRAASFQIGQGSALPPTTTHDEKTNSNLDRSGSAGRRAPGAGNASGDGSKLAGVPVERRPPVEPDGVKLPHVAPVNSAKNAPHVARADNAATSLKSTSATRGTKPAPHVAQGRWQVDYVRASENTYAFRLRWAEGRKRGTPLYIKRVAATVFQSIRKGNYEAFKQQLIASHSESSLHASHAAG